MAQSALETYSFYLGHSQHKYINGRGWIFFCGCLLCALVALLSGMQLWKTYTHEFVLYLRWQDALVFLLGCIAFISLGGSVFVLRFLHALREGYSQGMVMLASDSTITVRDLSPENLLSIFWIMNAAFWCCFAMLVGFLPIILFGWTIHIPIALLAVLATSIVVLLSVAGLCLSLVSACFIVVGSIGAATLCRKLGSSHSNPLSDRTALRIDDFVLTIINPSMSEAMLDLNLLSSEDQRQLLVLLYARWQAAAQVWSPSLGEEIAQALGEAERGEQSTVLV